ncbi:Chitin synthase, class 3 [Geranomyces michiganensis]|nr:Chitin synthase, class 3 [Geranomyces michiganensis]
MSVPKLTNITPLRRQGDSEEVTHAAIQQSLNLARGDGGSSWRLPPNDFGASLATLSSALHEEIPVSPPTPPPKTEPPEDAQSNKRRTGFAHQKSYENLAEIHAGGSAPGSPRSSRPLPKIPSHETNDARKGSLREVPPAISTKQQMKNIKVDTPRGHMGRRSSPRGGQISVAATDYAAGGANAANTPSLGTLRRKPSMMVRAERAQDDSGARTPAMAILSSAKEGWNIWAFVAQVMTCCIPSVLLKKFGHMEEKAVQQAWREKVALCTIITCMCGALGFLTYGFTNTVCKTGNLIGIQDFQAYTSNTHPNQLAVRGIVYDMTELAAIHENLPAFRAAASAQRQSVRDATGLDVTPYFWPPNNPPAVCDGMFALPYAPTCGTSAFSSSLNHCHTPTDLATLEATYPSFHVAPVIYEWPDVNGDNSTLMVYLDRVLNMAPYLSAGKKTFGDWTDDAIRTHLGADASRAFGGSPARLQMGQCLIALYAAGRIEEKTLGCIASDIILYVSLIMILSVVLIRFAMAVIFDWLISWQLGKLQEQHAVASRAALRRQVLDQGIVPFPMKGKLDAGSNAPSRKASAADIQAPPPPVPSDGQTAAQGKRLSTMAAAIMTGKPARDVVGASTAAVQRPSPTQNTDEQARLAEIRKRMAAMTTDMDEVVSAVAESPSMYSSPYGLEVYTIMMVAAYSEGEEGLRNTMESLASTIYSDDHKLIFIVADGLITGDGNSRSTPDILIDMLEMDKNWPLPPTPMSYVAISEGAKRHNMAQVYVAWYRHGDRCVPTILIVKCGTPAEKNLPKPGNRGKRDSQLVLMSFLQKVTFDDPMTPLDYDLFQKMHYLMGVTPDVFEIVLMVDADTKVAPDSVARMVASMVTDPLVMGLCGETRIANKSETWVTRIQVFEYYLSHHLAKAFESVFGGVTCLPGCFCMYRIKAPKGDGFWVPILCNPDIVATYSENRVDTLHKKNLLLLGEDRFLTTLMLGTFPHRKQIFVPRAYCKTVVPNEFKVLLSQRRRWINSTIHNLLELVLVRELCGVFCFSMQFIIVLELVGTCVLPAAITFTVLLIIITIIGPTIPVIPLTLLSTVLGLPAVLILLTTRRRIYIYWMLIYLLALPVWNAVLPMYAFWHFDDFSWGQTRKVAGEEAGGDKQGHGGTVGEGERDGGRDVPRRKWVDWETERRKVIVLDFEMEQRQLLEQEDFTDEYSDTQSRDTLIGGHGAVKTS